MWVEYRDLAQLSDGRRRPGLVPRQQTINTRGRRENGSVTLGEKGINSLLDGDVISDGDEITDGDDISDYFTEDEVDQNKEWISDLEIGTVLAITTINIMKIK